MPCARAPVPVARAGMSSSDAGSVPIPGAGSQVRVYLDEVLGREYASRFLAPGGAWDRWLEVRAVAALDPQYCRRAVKQLCAFVDETAEALVSLGCGS